MNYTTRRDVTSTGNRALCAPIPKTEGWGIVPRGRLRDAGDFVFAVGHRGSLGWDDGDGGALVTECAVYRIDWMVR